MKKILLAMLLPLSAFAQFDFSADLVSGYVWRGSALTSSPAFQPGISFEKMGLTVGTWGSYAFSPLDKASNEIDIYASYGYEVSEGNALSLTVTDYYLPIAGMDANGDAVEATFSDYSSDGTHVVEVAAGYEGIVNAAVAVNVLNDDFATTYMRLGYPHTCESGTSVEFFAGGTLNESPAYGTDGPALTEVGIAVSKDVVINDKVSLATSAQFLVNPTTDQAMMVFGLGF